MDIPMGGGWITRRLRWQQTPVEWAWNEGVAMGAMDGVERPIHLSDRLGMATAAG